MSHRCIWFCGLIFCLISFQAVGENALSKFDKLHHAGLLLLDVQGRSKISKAADQAFIPASTTKLVTAWMALNHWGEGYRFSTDFFYEANNKILWIKGKGDPFLVSEELSTIAGKLRQLGLTRLNGIALDGSYFAPNAILPGTGHTDNPYDAVPSAIAANFNSVYLKRSNGRIQSGEAQTPLTPFAIQLGKQLRKRNIRINTGPDPRAAEQNFAQLLAAFLRTQGVEVGQLISFGRVPELPLYYRHFNSKTLAEMIQPMLKYSTNFLANQLILMLCAEAYGPPAKAKQVEELMHDNLTQRFHWQHFVLQDGAGLSRANRLTPKQLVDVVNAFRPWKKLLPEIEPGVYAKTGTLNQVSTLAGFLTTGKNWQPFALMINESVDYQFRNQLAESLVQQKVTD